MNGPTTGGALPSKRLMRLEAAIGRAVHPVDQACLRAERAMHWAMQRHFGLAQAEIDALHAQFDHHPNPAVSGWLCLAEGMCHLFDSPRGEGARDKFMRAEALSAAARLPQLQALSAAWLAQVDHMALDFEAMAGHLRKALDLAAVDHHTARARACLTLGASLHFASRLDLAQPWYAHAREHANAEGDEALLGALGFSLAAQHCDHACQAAVFGGAEDAQVRHALASVGSADNFHQWVGAATPLDSGLQSLRAAALSVLGESGQALALYQSSLAEGGEGRAAALAVHHRADMAWCRWRMGDSEGARADAQAVVVGLAARTRADDSAVAHGRLAQVFRALGDTDAALRHEAQARESWASHQQVQARVLALVGDWAVR